MRISSALSSGLGTPDCGSEFIREEARTPDKGLSPAKSPSRMNSLPRGISVALTAGDFCGSEACPRRQYRGRAPFPHEICGTPAACNPCGSEFIREEARTPDKGLSPAKSPSRMNSLPRGISVALTAGDFCGSEACPRRQYRGRAPFPHEICGTPAACNPCGSEFIREEAHTPDKGLSPAKSPSRMNSLPRGISVALTAGDFCGSEACPRRQYRGRAPFPHEICGTPAACNPCGSEFIREEARASDEDLSPAKSPSRMNSLPQLIPICRNSDALL
ncbi:Uncharacterised protein [Paucimonas lemoignei]|nr:Uncharacterised protein [Paucimonas lemoignei]